MGRLLVTLRGEDDELAWVRGLFHVGRRQLRLLRAHFGEDVLFARTGECFAVAHMVELAESGRGLRFEVRRPREVAHTVPVPFGASAPLAEISDDTFDDILSRGFATAPAFAEDHRILAGVPEKSDDEIALIAAYGWRCAISRYRATTPAEAVARLEVVWLRDQPAEGVPQGETAALPVDAALAYALRHGHIVIADDYRLVLRVPLPVAPPHPLRRRLASPSAERYRLGAEAIRAHRARFPEARAGSC